MVCITLSKLVSHVLGVSIGLDHFYFHRDMAENMSISFVPCFECIPFIYRVACISLHIYLFLPGVFPRFSSNVCNLLGTHLGKSHCMSYVKLAHLSLKLKAIYYPITYMGDFKMHACVGLYLIFYKWVCALLITHMVLLTKFVILE